MFGIGITMPWYAGGRGVPPHSDTWHDAEEYHAIVIRHMNHPIVIRHTNGAAYHYGVVCMAYHYDVVNVPPAAAHHPIVIRHMNTS